MVGLRKTLMDIYFLSAINFPIHFYLPLNPAIHRMGNATNILCPRCKELEESHSHFTFYCKLFKNTLEVISELVNLKYSFNTSFKISLKSVYN